MHFEILIEDQSGKVMLDQLLPRLLDGGHTFRVHPYKGIGRIPRNLHRETDHAKRILLNQLPRLLRGYGRTFTEYPEDYPACVLVVVDLDDRPQSGFLEELQSVLKECIRAPLTRFCLAIEEGEAWLLGDRAAVLKAYPRAKTVVLDSYLQDSICGTWEVLANAVYPGGAKVLQVKGWKATGAEKSAWAVAITPHLDPTRNQSPSFRHFHRTIRELAGLPTEA